MTGRGGSLHSSKPSVLRFCLWAALFFPNLLVSSPPPAGWQLELMGVSRLAHRQRTTRRSSPDSHQDPCQRSGRRRARQQRDRGDRDHGGVGEGDGHDVALSRRHAWEPPSNAGSDYHLLGQSVVHAVSYLRYSKPSLTFSPSPGMVSASSPVRDSPSPRLRFVLIVPSHADYLAPVLRSVGITSGNQIAGFNGGLSIYSASSALKSSSTS